MFTILVKKKKTSSFFKTKQLENGLSAQYIFLPEGIPGNPKKAGNMQNQEKGRFYQGINAVHRSAYCCTCFIRCHVEKPFPGGHVTGITDFPACYLYF
jgi:hypothetical protein